MKKWLRFCPCFMDRLWFQLALTYTSLAIFAFAVLIMIMYGLNDYQDFHKTLTLENVETQVISEKITLAETIRANNRIEWQKRALSNIREKLINLERDEDKVEIYRITNSSRPEVYMRIIDIKGNKLISNPSDFPLSVSDRFASQQISSDIQTHTIWLTDNRESIWIEMPVTDDNNTIMGHLQVLYIAEYDWWIQIGSIINFLIAAFDWVIICSIPIGIACGLVAARYVTKQLQKMNEVTESWRQGNFEARIQLPSDDVLTRHSQHLNDMAQDLEMYLSLKQDLAVINERTRVARELHDTVKQKLFALGLQLATAKTKPTVLEAAGEHIIEAETITREAQQDLIEIITQLRPAVTYEASLYERMGIISDDFTRRFGVGIEVTHADAVQLTPHGEHHVLRIVQESFMNAVRHGKASNITISCNVNNNLTTLMISDNGSGFDDIKKTNGFGITSMRDRMKDLPQGKFEIKSAVSGGTTILLSWKDES